MVMQAPNPSTGLVTIEFDKESTGDIEVVDITGRIILKRNFDQLRQINMDLSSSNGLHIINVYHTDGTFEVLKHITIR